MTGTPTPKGERFSQLYIERGAPLPDNARCRVRLGQYLIEQFDYKFTEPLSLMLVRELGVQMPTGGNSYAANIAALFRTADIRDVLDAVTLIHRMMGKHFQGGGTASHWRQFVERVFKEGNLAYTVDEECGIHPLVDREFERNIATAIAGLAAARYEAVRKAFEASEAKLEQTPPDLKGAVRDTFEAAETVTKLMSSSGKALTAGFVKGDLEPSLQKLYGSDRVAAMVAARLAQSFADWVDAAHPYRHGQKAEEPIEPPQELAVLLISQGASFLRWLVDVDGGSGERK